MWVISLLLFYILGTQIQIYNIPPDLVPFSVRVHKAMFWNQMW